jgi:hypothetical protein
MSHPWLPTDCKIHHHHHIYFGCTETGMAAERVAEMGGEIPGAGSGEVHPRGGGVRMSGR